MLAALICAALAATIFRPPPTPGPFARDFEAYYAAGATWNAGGDPWSRDIWRAERTIAGVDGARDEVLPFVGPAASLPLWSLLARLPFGDARIVWEALLALAFAALLLASLALAGIRPGPVGLAATIVATVISGPMLSDFALGQVALIGAAGVAQALLGFARGTAWSFAATVIAGIQPNLALPLAARLTDRRAIATIAGAGVLFVALTLALGGGPAGFAVYLHRLGEHGAGERYITIQYAIPAILASFGWHRALATAAGSVAGIGALAAAAVIAVRHRDAPVIATCVAVAALPLAVPFFHEHDFVIEVLPVLVLAASAHARVRTLAGIAAACVLVDWFGLAQRPAAIAHIGAFAFAVAFAFAALPRRTPPSRADAAPALTVLGLLAVCVPLALAAPAPTWPDALSATYHAPPHADVSAVWAQEQHLAGLDAVQPVWGVLRTVPLAGCVLLALAGCYEIKCRRS